MADGFEDGRPYPLTAATALPRSQKIQSVFIGLIAIVWAGLTLLAWFYILPKMPYGADISDTAYYLLSIFKYAEIEGDLTLFGPVWSVLSPFQTILGNRYLGFAVLVIANGVLAWSSFKLLWPKSDLITNVLTLLFACASAPLYYAYWLPDPSYNLMTIGLLSLLVALFFLLTTITAPTRTIRSWTTILIVCAGIGFVFTALVFTKISSAAAAGLLMTAGFAVLRWRVLNPMTILRLAAACVAGSALLLSILAMAGIGPLDAISTMKEGYHLSSLLTELHISPMEKLLSYLSYMSGLVFFSRSSVLVLCGAVAIALAGRRTRYWESVRNLAFLGLLAATVFLVIDIWRLPRAGLWLEILNGTYGFLAVYALACTLVAEQNRRSIALLGWATLVLLPLVYIFGTGNVWSYHIRGAMAVVLVLGNFGACAMGHRDYPIFVLPVAGLLLLCGMVTVNQIETNPYRMEVPFAQLTHEAEIGPYRERIFVSEELAAFYNNLLPARDLIAKQDPRPLLIDMTGRAPMAIYQLDARLPKIPWLLGGYPGSVAMLDRVLSSFEVQELRNAWILEAEKLETGLPRQSLNRIGLNFPESYRAIAEVPLPYVQATAILYAPVSQTDEVE